MCKYEGFTILDGNDDIDCHSLSKRVTTLLNTTADLLTNNFSQEVQRFLELAYSDSVDHKREAIDKINQLEARSRSCSSSSRDPSLCVFRVNPLPMGLSSLKHILKVELIRAQNQTDENSSLQYACAVAVLK